MEMNSFDISRKRVICSILELERQKFRLTADSASQNHKVLFDEAVDLFGTWTLALEYAGVRVSRKRLISYLPRLLFSKFAGEWED